ncbi:MAG TPA: hypothetical protein VIV40_09585 [Kofleriaceae bacterium]
MRTHILLLISAAALATTAGCNQIECGDGTIERDGKCEPPNVTSDPAKCGAFTELIGDQCVPKFPPTVCEDGTTVADTDPTTGVITCKGEGGLLPCGATDIARSPQYTCPIPTGATKQNICGQIYDFQDGKEFRLAGATMGTKCSPTSPATTGPCALQIVAYDALTFAMAPTTTPPLPVGSVTIDECGRFKILDIETNGTGPFIGIGVDDAGMPLGPSGITVTAAVATGKLAKSSTSEVEAFIVKPSTTQLWASGGPPLSGGIYAPVYRAHKLPSTDPFAPQMGVTFARSGVALPANDYYFQAAIVDRTTVDGAATATGANGTALVTNATTNDSVSYGGLGGLGNGCKWELHAGASLPGIVFIQIFRKADITGQTCAD